MKIDRSLLGKYKINHESDSVDVANAVVNTQEPEGIDMSNPFEAEQSLQIVNSRPSLDELNNHQPLERVMELNSKLEDARERMDEQSKDISNLSTDFSEDDKANTEYFMYVLNNLSKEYEFDLFKVNKEDLENDTEAAKAIVDEERNDLTAKINGVSWVNLESDFSTMHDMIDSAIQAATALDGKAKAGLELLNKVELSDTELDLKDNIYTIGNMRHFAEPSSLMDILIGMMYIIDINTPSFSDDDNTLLKALSKFDKESILEMMDHIDGRMFKDPLNQLFINKAQALGKKQPHEVCYTSIAGAQRIKYFEIDNGRMTKSNYSIPDEYTGFKLTLGDHPAPVVKKELIRTIKNFSTKFSSLFNLYDRKLQTLSTYIKPIVVSLNTVQDKESLTLLNNLLTYVRSYYIDLLKDRINDKIMMYAALLDIVIKLCNNINPDAKAVGDETQKDNEAKPVEVKEENKETPEPTEEKTEESDKKEKQEEPKKEESTEEDKKEDNKEVKEDKGSEEDKEEEDMPEINMNDMPGA